MFCPDVGSVVGVMNDKGYQILDNGGLNLVGIRVGLSATNKFDDTFVVFRAGTHGSVWAADYFPCTTDAGYHHLEHGLTKGTAILAPGQYVDAYGLGKHQGKYDALVQVGPVTVYRDRNKDHELDYANPDTGLFGINIHRANPNTTSKQVDKWSAGCTVIASPADFEHLMTLVREHIAAGYGKRFSYALLERRDFK